MKMTQGDVIVGVLKRHGRLNAYQVAANCHLSPHQVLKRLGELEGAGKVAQAKEGGAPLRAPTESRTARVYEAR